MTALSKVREITPPEPEAGEHSAFPPPHWVGERRPYKARRVRLQSRFPSLGYLTYLVSQLGYAAFAAMVQAHQPWLRTVDRRGASIASVVHPYIPAAPGRRTKVGGGLTNEQVRQALAKKRWDSEMKKAVFEIVYRRRSNLQVSNESGIPVETLSVYASRLRKEIGKKSSPCSRSDRGLINQGEICTAR